MRRFLAIVLLALLPLQFSWAAVASYCGHEQQAGSTHFGHHEHQRHADAAGGAEPLADAESTPDGDKAPGAMDLDCGHCHGHCSVMLTPLPGLPAALATTPPTTSLDEAGGAHAPTRPERPQWLPLA